MNDITMSWPAQVVSAAGAFGHGWPRPMIAPAVRFTALPLPAQRSPLSEREREVLERIAAGDSNKLIARALGLSPHTVKRHVANILDKLDARTRAQAAACLRAGG